MKVLFVTQHYLHISGGAAFASTALVNAFAEISSEITLMYPSKEGVTICGLNKKISLLPIIYNKPSLLKLLNTYCGRIHRFYSVFHELLAQQSFDLVVFDNCIVSHGLINEAIKKKIPAITIHHNYQVEIVKDNMPWYLRIPMLYWVEKAERAAVNLSVLNLTLTESDKNALHKHYSQKAKIETIGIFESSNKDALPIDNNRSKGHNYLISGNLSVKQTVDSLYPWIKNYYDLLKKVDKEARIIIAGKDPQQALYSLCKGKDIEIIPSPISMEPILLNADYYLCPTGLGSGIKLRIMDGLKAGLPVLTQKDSLRGYETFYNDSVYAFNDSNDFCEALQTMRNCDVKPSSIQRKYLEIFSFDSGVDRLKKILLKKEII